MADTKDTRPGVTPVDLRTGPTGELPDLDGRRAWIWCRSERGDRADFRSDRLAAARRRGYTPVADYPVHFGPSARRGKPATKRSTSADATPTSAPPTGDAHDATPSERALTDKAGAAGAATTTQKGGRSR